MVGRNQRTGSTLPERSTVFLVILFVVVYEINSVIPPKPSFRNVINFLRERFFVLFKTRLNLLKLIAVGDNYVNYKRRSVSSNVYAGQHFRTALVVG